MTSDFSMYMNMDWHGIYDGVYKNRWAGVYCQFKGLNVIPSVGWASESTYDICFAGIEVDRGQLDNYVFLFDETQDNFRIGMSNAPTGGTQAVATRQDNPIANGIAYWNSVETRFDTSNNLIWNLVKILIN